MKSSFYLFWAFTLLSPYINAQNCAFSDLILSEIYDNNSGSLGFIEVYNGTTNTITLSEYRIRRYGSLSATNLGHTYYFPNNVTIAPNEVLVGKVSNDPSNGVYDNFNFTFFKDAINSDYQNSGFNDDDRLELVLNSTDEIVDDWHDDGGDGQKGFTYTRKITVSGPNPNYNLNEWDILSSETAANLGIFNYDYTPDKYYRSKTTGNWESASTWELAPSSAGPWADACIAPNAENSDYIHILNTHTVTANTDMQLDQVVVEVGGTMISSENAKITYTNEDGADLEILGTYQDDGGSGNGSNFSINDATWILGENATIIKTHNSSVGQYRDNYDGGMSNIPSNANWHFRYDGSGVVAVASINMYYPNLYFESTNGNHSFQAFTELLKGSSGFATVKGDLNIGTTGSGTVEVININGNTSPMQVLGNLNIGENSKLINTDGTDEGTGITIMGDLSIDEGGQLDYSATSGVLNIHGDWFSLSNDGFNEGSSSVHFLGTNSSTFSSINTEDFYQLTINKDLTNFTLSLTMDGNINVKNNFTFTKGIVDNTANKTITFFADATASSASDLSFIDGPVRKITQNTGTTNFIFPTGDTGLYAPIEISSIGQGETFHAEYFKQAHNPANPLIDSLENLSNIEYWELDDIGNTGPSTNVTLHWGDHSAIADLNHLRVAHYTDLAGVNTWIGEGQEAITGNSTSGSITSHTITDFSPFTFAYSIPIVILPFDLLSFEVQKKENTALLDWSVLNEKIGDQYCLEHSSDGYNFKTIDCVNALGLTSANYQHIDSETVSGNNYYRILQRDFTGAIHYSPIRVVHFAREKDIKLYPSIITNGMLNIQLENNTSQYFVQIIDELGRIIQEDKVTGSSRFDLHSLSNGVYFVRMIDQDSQAAKTYKVSVLN